MDATFTAVIRLHEQEISMKETARRLNISHAKVRKILLTAGYIETAESKMQARGMTVPQIAAALDKTENAVLGNLPYSKGQYNAEYPTINAIRVRICREKKKTEAE